MKLRVSIAALLLGAGLSVAVAKTAPVPIDPLLRAAIAAPENVSYVAVVEVVRMGSQSAEASVCRIEHRAPDLTRRTYTTPSNLAGDSVVTKGDLMFTIEAKRAKIVETRDDAEDAGALRADYALLRENYRVVRQGDEIFDGRQTIDLAIISQHTRRTAMLAKIDAANDTVLDRQEFAPNGSLVSETRFEQVRYATPPAADFTLPSRYALVRDPAFATQAEEAGHTATSTDFAVREPRSLPGGFAPVESVQLEVHGVRSVHLLYSDGLRTVSLFENAKASTLETSSLAPQKMRVGTRSAEYLEDGATALLTWSDGTLYYTLVGDVGLVDLPSLAASITP
jgi:negative regulator of sigma E activity